MLKSSKYLVNSITEAYPEVKTAMKKLDTELKAGFEEAVSGQGIQNGAMGRKLCEIVKDSLDNVEMSDTSRDALSEALEAGLGNIQADMEEFAEVIKNSGMEMPKGFGEGMKDTEALAAVSGSRDDALEYFGDIIGENDKWSAIVNTCNENGANIPEQIANGIDSNSSVVAFATENLLNMIENSLGSSINVQVSLDMANSAMQAGEGVYKSTIKEPVKATNSNSKGSPVKTNTSKPIKLVKNARGGIYSNPIFSILAEEGDEAVIPLNGSSRAKSLWQNAGKMLGMEPVEDMTLYNTTAITRDKQVYEDFKLITARQSQSSGSNAAGGNINITYSPQITIKGNADKKVVNDALSSNKAEIIKILDAYFDGKKRASFSKQISGGRHG